MPKFSQGTRLMQITTPFEDDFLLINELTVSEGISQLFLFEVELLHEESKPWPHRDDVDPSKILGQPVSIKISQQDGGGRMFNGFVNRFSQGDRGRLFSRYRISVVPDVWGLTQVRQSRIFQQKTVPSILKDVFKGYENRISWEFEYDYKPRNYCVQYRETDFDFASRLMEEEGIYYYFEFGDDGSHTLIVSDKPMFTRNCPNKSEISFADVGGKNDFESVILEWATDYQIATGTILFWDHHLQLPVNPVKAPRSTAFNFGENSKWEAYDYPGGYARKFDGIEPGGSERSSDLNNVSPDGKRTAQTAMEVIDARHKLGHGKSDCTSLTAGHRFKLSNHAVKSLNGEYVITAVSHKAYQWPAYQTEGEDETGAPEGAEEYFNRFEALAHGRPGSTAFRPERKTRKPVIHGSQTALVVGKGDEEIDTDKYGRIKVHFFWDREGQADGADSCWLPVAQPWAGKQWGSVFIPRVGMEVVVHFLEGDPDQPIVTGCVYNPKYMPPYELPKYKTMSTIKSDSSKGHKGFNELRFEDKKSKEQVFMHSQKRYDLRARGSMYETCGGNRQEVIGYKVKEKADDDKGGNLAVTVGGNHDFHIAGDQYIGIDKDCYEVITGNRTEGFDGYQQTAVKSKVEINSRTITLEASQKITLVVGSSCIIVDMMGITIQGPMVKINCGAFAPPMIPAKIGPPLDAEQADTGEPGYLDRPKPPGGGGRKWGTTSLQHAPSVTKNADGSYSVGGDKLKVKGTDAFTGKAMEDLSLLYNTPTGKKTMDDINAGKHTTTITELPMAKAPAVGGGQAIGVRPGMVDGTGSDTTIEYAPDYTPVYTDQNGKKVNGVKPAVLGHELKHASNNDKGTNTLDNNEPAEPTSNDEESKVIGIHSHKNDTNTENDLIKELGGKYKRKDHDFTVTSE